MKLSQYHQFGIHYIWPVCMASCSKNFVAIKPVVFLKMHFSAYFFQVFEGHSHQVGIQYGEIMYIQWFC